MYVFRWMNTVKTDIRNYGEYIMGADWFLDETSGTSYEVLEQGHKDAVVYQRVEPKPRDWIGAVALETVRVPYLIQQNNEQGMWVSHGLWNTLYWRGDLEGGRAFVAKVQE